MQELTHLLKAATAAIEPEYFLLKIDGGNPVYRERVYCYELYHQMRLRWPEDCPFLLNGEVDKSSHATLARLGAAGLKPDFLVHQPGSMAGNYAVVEVKAAVALNGGVEKDIETLSLFRSAVGYLRAIYLIYGSINNSRINRLRRAAERTKTPASIEVWIHPGPGEHASHQFTLGT